MYWIGLTILLIIAGAIIYFYSKKKGVVTLSLSEEQAQLVSQLCSKEREELSHKMQDMVDQEALKGNTVSIDSLCKETSDMSEDVKKGIARFKLGLLAKYGPTIPVNTAHRILWEYEGNGQMWSDSPGCFERHLQRRDGNLLFPPKRRIVIRKEIEEAREKDFVEQQRYREKVKTFTSNIVTAQEENLQLDRATSMLKEAQEMLEEGATIGGDIAEFVKKLQNIEESLTRTLNEVNPDLKDLLNRLQSLTLLKRSPYFAQSSRKDSPILKEEEIPTLLSEDMETISSNGYASRAFAPGYRPNESDIQIHLEKAVSQGFSKERAVQIIAAWNSTEIETNMASPGNDKTDH